MSAFERVVILNVSGPGQEKTANPSFRVSWLCAVVTRPLDCGDRSLSSLLSVLTFDSCRSSGVPGPGKHT